MTCYARAHGSAAAGTHPYGSSVRPGRAYSGASGAVNGVACHTRDARRAVKVKARTREQPMEVGEMASVPQDLDAQPDSAPLHALAKLNDPTLAA